jgi:hypothetical protein
MHRRARGQGREETWCRCEPWRVLGFRTLRCHSAGTTCWVLETREFIRGSRTENVNRNRRVESGSGRKYAESIGLETLAIANLLAGLLMY